jgi:hypothetical protein
MDLDKLARPDGPWLIPVSGTDGEAFDLAQALYRAGSGRVVTRVLRGRKMRTSTSLFDEVSAALQFPPYFGENWNALDECLTDLDWLPGDTYVLLILDAIHVLDQADPGERAAVWRIFKNAAREWGQPAEGICSRPAKAFRVLVHGTHDNIHQLQQYLPADDVNQSSDNR